MSVMSIGQGRSKHWFTPLMILAALAVLFFVGLLLHEAGVMPEPMNGWYEWLHMTISGGTMAKSPDAWMWGG